MLLSFYKKHKLLTLILLTSVTAIIYFIYKSFTDKATYDPIADQDIIIIQKFDSIKNIQKGLTRELDTFIYNDYKKGISLTSDSEVQILQKRIKSLDSTAADLNRK